MELELQNTYTEVYQILNLLGNKYINKIPDKLFQLFKEGQNVNYKTNINKDTKLEDMQVSKNALIIISILNLKYWANAEEKERLKKIYDDNENEFQNKINFYKKDDWLNRNKKDIIDTEEPIKEEKNLIIQENVSIISKIKIFFRNLFNKGKH